MKKHYNIIVKGIVQGVGYRYVAKQEADRFGICGFTRNECDGSVLIEAEGDETALTLFLDWCYSGPSAAVVDSVGFEEGSLKGYSTFSIVSASES